MLPAIMLSTLAAVLASIVNRYKWGYIILAFINGSIAFLLAIINFLKMDARAEAHKISAHQYDKLQCIVEFKSASILLCPDKSYNQEIKWMQKVLIDALDMCGKKIQEIKETNRFMVPENVRHLYPVISTINVFSVIKKIEDHKKKTITTMKNIKNEIRYLNQLSIHANYKLYSEHEIQQRTIYLLDLKKHYIKEILQLKSAYTIVDQMFLQEIKNAEIKKQRKYFCNSQNTEIENPLQMNDFITKIMDPFRNEFQYDSRTTTLPVIINNDTIDVEYINNFIKKNTNKSHGELLFENHEN